MKLVVMKFGGSSVANAGKVKHVAGRIIQKKKEGFRIVVVVSAPGDMTDELIELADGVTKAPPPREMDMLLATGEQASIALLCMALHAKGHAAISLTGPQAGIYADIAHTKARITHIQPKKIVAELAKRRIVVVAGFQGLNPNEDIATLGRGGSDLTAIALAAALKADLCEIYTDVEGVYTTDPRVVPDARKLDEISYDEMLELASLGAKVMQSRSVEFAKKFGVVFEVRSSLNENEGTLVKEETTSMEDIVVRGVSLDKNQAKVTLVGVPDKPGVAARIFKAIGDANVNVDMIVQNISHGRGTPATDLSFTVDKPDLLKAQKVIDALRPEIGFVEVIATDAIGKLSLVGVGMKSHTGVAGKMFDVLAREGVNIEMISTSEIKISVIVELAKGEQAMRAVHEAFLS